MACVLSVLPSYSTNLAYLNSLFCISNYLFLVIDVYVFDRYGVKIDVWAAGIIAYILLCGFPPFRSETNSQEELFDAILAGDLQFPSPHWDHVSESAKSLISDTLNMDQDSRLSADEILQHSWLSVS